MSPSYVSHFLKDIYTFLVVTFAFFLPIDGQYSELLTVLVNKLQRIHVLPNSLISFIPQYLRLSQCCFENSLVEYYVMLIGKFLPTLRRILMPSFSGSRSHIFRYRKVNGEDVPEHALKAYRRKSGTAPLIPSLGIRWKCAVYFKHWPLYRRGKTAGTVSFG